MTASVPAVPKKEDGAAADGTAADGAARGSGLGRRHLQMALLFLGISVAYACRINLSVCIVDMTAKNSTYGFPVYDWDQSQRGLVLSSFFWGYVLTQVPGGMLSQRFGPKVFLMTGIVGCALLTLLTPLAVAWGGWKLLCALRMLEGLFQGLVFPSSHTMLGRWVPPLERGRAGALVYSGTSLGTVSVMAGAGLLASSPLGWPSGFYVPGAIGLLWGLAWLLLAANSPASCKRISAEERQYIEQALGTSSSGEKRLRVPWGSIMTSVPMWCLILVHCGQNFGHWMLLTQMPNYMKGVLHFDIKQNGLNSALPYLCLLLASGVVGYVSQVINERHILSIGASRKMFNTFAHWGSGSALLLLAFLHVTPQAAVALLTLAVSLEAGTLAGYLVNHVDLSPNFGGAMIGVTNGLANFMGIIAPIFVSQVVGDTTVLSQEEIESRWGVVFIVAACIFYCGNLIYIIGGSGEVQPWNSPSSPSKDSHASRETIISKI